MAIELPDPNGKLAQALQQELSSGETIWAAVKSREGERSALGAGMTSVLVATSLGAIIVKPGAGPLGLGYHRYRYPYQRITSIHVRSKPIKTGIVEIHHQDEDQTLVVVWGEHTEIRRKTLPSMRAPNMFVFTNLGGRMEAVRAVVAFITDEVARAQAPAMATPASQQSTDIPELIRQLAALRDAGTLSTDEFEAKKTELLRRL